MKERARVSVSAFQCCGPYTKEEEEEETQDTVCARRKRRRKSDVASDGENMQLGG